MQLPYRTATGKAPAAAVPRALRADGKEARSFTGRLKR